MNKNLLTILICLFTFVAAQQGFSQCTPVPTNTALISPDTIVNFVSGTVGIPYQQVVLVHPPSDTTATVPPFGAIAVHINHIQVDNVSNLPPGLTYACNPSTCDFPGGVSGCILISGTPTVAGLYPLQVFITTYGTIFGGTIALNRADTIESYRILINVNTGIDNYSALPGFQLMDVSPNPVKENLRVTLTSSESASAELSIFNILGKEVSVKKALVLKQGINNLNYDTRSLYPGVYMFTVKNKQFNMTGKFVVSGK